MQPLSTIGPGRRARLGAPDAVEPDVLRDLWAMRLLPGETVTVVTVVGRGGPVIVQGAGGVFAIGRRLASRLPAEVLAA